MNAAATNLDRAKRRTALLAALLALAMIGLAYASVPLYRMFCQATGFGGTTGRAEASALVIPAFKAAHPDQQEVTR